ncbi:MAG: polysulfide reductase NrfD, partial [Deltaproteobacteria bacterium]|nr:polysulfide reductase NrfD [Deltaproteobacteria bacterium]
MNGKKSLYLAWMTALGLLMLLGIYTTVKLFGEGHWLFNTNDVLVWSMPLVVYVFLALSSSGLTLLSAIPIVFGVKRYKPVAKRLVLLAIATLCGGFVSIGLELGNVWHLFYIIISPNFSSPIWWMGAIYGIELVFLAVKLWRMHVGDWDSGFSKAMGTASFFCALIAPLMIGSVFGITESRVTYFGPVMSIYCLLMALLSGTALFVLYSMVYHKVLGNGSMETNAEIYEDFCLIFKYAAGAVVIFTIVKVAIEAATVVPEFLSIRKFVHPFGTLFGFHLEVVIGLFIPFILLMIPSVLKSVGGKISIGALAWFGALGRHMQILIAGQSHPIGPKAEQFPAV